MVKRSAYYRAPSVRRKIVKKTVVRRGSSPTTRRVVKKTVIVKKRPAYVRTYYGGSRTRVNLYSRAYLSSPSYIRLKASFNYAQCSGYGYFNSLCIGYGSYTYTYWD